MLEYTEQGRLIKRYNIKCQDERNAINRILSQIDLQASWDVDIEEIQEILLQHRTETKKAYSDMDIKVNDGFLYIDKEPKGRIAPMLKNRKVNICSDYVYYLEGKILARQGL